MSGQNMAPEEYSDLLSKLQRMLGKDKLIIEFIEPDTLHPGSNTQTIAEVASSLEKRYHLLEKFCERIKSKVCEKFALELLRTKKLDRAFRMVEELIKNEWREYILESKHGITTKASQERGSEPFVDTGAYYRNLTCRITND